MYNKPLVINQDRIMSLCENCQFNIEGCAFKQETLDAVVCKYHDGDASPEEMNNTIVHTPKFLALTLGVLTYKFRLNKVNNVIKIKIFIICIEENTRNIMDILNYWMNFTYGLTLNPGTYNIQKQDNRTEISLEILMEADYFFRNRPSSRRQVHSIFTKWMEAHKKEERIHSGALPYSRLYKLCREGNKHGSSIKIIQPPNAKKPRYVPPATKLSSWQRPDLVPCVPKSLCINMEEFNS